MACAILNNIAFILKDELSLDDDNDENEEVTVQPSHWQPGEGFVMRALIEHLFH